MGAPFSRQKVSCETTDPIERRQGRARPVRPQAARPIDGEDSKMSRPPDFDLNGFLPYQLDAIASQVSESLLDLYGERFDLRVPDWRVLVWLDQAPELAAKDIAVRARMDRATVSIRARTAMSLAASSG